MKILYVNTMYYPDVGGGAEITLRMQCEMMAKRGHQVHVFCLARENESLDEINGVFVHRVLGDKYFPLGVRGGLVERFKWHLKDINNKYLASKLDKLIREIKPDLVSCHNLSGVSISAWDAVKKNNIPLVQYVHDQYLLCPKSHMSTDVGPCKNRCTMCAAMRLNHKKESARVDCLIGVSKFIVDKLKNYGYFENVPAQFIRNVSDRVVEPRLFKCSQNIFTYGYIGTLSYMKGVEFAIEEFLRINIDNSQFLIAGRGEYESELIIKFGMHKNIKFVGYVDPYDFFCNVDTLIVPTLAEETLGRVVFEAMGKGVPVIGSNRGGIPEMIIDGITGYIFNPESKGDLGEKMLTCMNMSNNQYHEMAMKSFEASKEYHDPESWIAKVENILFGVRSA